jgi:hypothetical protein
MKKILLAFFVLISCTLSAQDKYFVTVIKGGVSKQNGSKLNTGEKIMLTDKLAFKSKESFVILLHPTKGRYIVAPTNAPVSKDNVFLVLIKDYMQLHQDKVRLSSRILEDDISALAQRIKTDAGISNKTLVIDTLKIPLNASEFKDVDNEENFFFLQLVADPPANHKLTVKNRMLLITKEDFTFDEKLYTLKDGQLNLGYVQGYNSTKKVNLIGGIEPVFMSKEEGLEIVKAVKSSMAGQPRNQILNEIFTQLYFLYGKPDTRSIEKLYTIVK